LTDLDCLPFARIARFPREGKIGQFLLIFVSLMLELIAPVR
jgi:hypothetical protein